MSTTTWTTDLSAETRATTTATRKTTIVCNTFIVKTNESDNATINPVNTIEWTIITPTNNNVSTITNISNLQQTDINNKSSKGSNNFEKRRKKKKKKEKNVDFKKMLREVTNMLPGGSPLNSNKKKNKHYQHQHLHCLYQLHLQIQLQHLW